MNNISNLHKSFSFTIILILSTFVGIIITLQYSNSKNNYLLTESFEKSLDITNKIYSHLDNDYSNKKVNIREFEKKINPEYSVPVQLILGKIKKVNKLYLPELKLAFLENDKKYFILNRDLYFNR